MIAKLYEKLRLRFHHDPVEVLRERGAVIGRNVHIYDGGGSSIDYQFGFLLTIGNNVTISNSTILLHDASMKKELHYVMIGKISIGNDVFIGAGSTILPNVTIGNNVIIGAGSVVSKDIPDGVVAVGNPIRIIKTYEEYIDKCNNLIATKPCFKEEAIEEKKDLVKEKICDCGFIE